MQKHYVVDFHKKTIKVEDKPEHIIIFQRRNNFKLNQYIRYGYIAGLVVLFLISYIIVIGC